MVNLFLPDNTDYTTRAAELARQQKLAEMLSQMGAQETPVSTAGGITAPVSPYSALAKALTSFGGSYLAGKSAADEAALRKADKLAAQEAIKNIYTMPAGSRQPDVGVVDTQGIKDFGPSIPITGKLNVQDTATTPQQQMQMLAPLAGNGPVSQSVYGTFMPEAMKQQAANAETQRQIAKFAPLIASLPQDQQSNIARLAGVDPNKALDVVSKAFEKQISPEAPKTAGGLQWTPDKGWVEIPGYTEQAKQLAEARHITIENPNNAKLSSEDLDFMARQALTGDTSVFSGLGYGSAGAQNRALLRSKITSVAKEMGIKPENVAAINAQFFGTKAGERTLGTRTANIGMAVAEANRLMPLALEASKNVSRTNYPSLNAVLLAGERGTGDPNVVRLGVATNSLINTYARAINPSGVPTVSDKEHARELLENAWSNGQYAAAVDQLKMEMEVARQAPGEVREEFRNAITGNKPASNTQQKIRTFNPVTGKIE